MSKKFKIYSKDGCEYCILAKAILKNDNYDFETIMLNDRKDRENLYRKIDDEEDILVNMMPQIYYGDEYIGGYDKLEEFIRKDYNFEELKNISGIICENLNNIIDINYNPTDDTEFSNKRHRPIGIGIQGLADAFIELRYNFDSKEALELNNKIMETIYFGALEKSISLAKEREEKIIEYLNCNESENLKKDLLLKELQFTINDSNKQFNLDIQRSKTIKVAILHMKVHLLARVFFNMICGM